MAILSTNCHQVHEIPCPFNEVKYNKNAYLFLFFSNWRYELLMLMSSFKIL